MRLGSPTSGDGPVDRALSHQVLAGGVRRFARRQFEDQSRLVERLLVFVAFPLRMVQRLLTDISGKLLAVNPCLVVVIQDRVRTMTGRARVVSTSLVAVQLLVVDAGLVSIAHELLAIGDRLREFHQALFSGQLVGTRRMF